MPPDFGPAGQDKKKKTSFAAMTAARLAAVQAVYQLLLNETPARVIVEEYRQHRLQALAADYGMEQPNAALFTKVIGGVELRRDDLLPIINEANASRKETQRQTEPLLQAVFLCASFELLAHHEFDTALIISDYLDVSHAFFDGGEPALVNGVLDRISRAVRDSA